MTPQEARDLAARTLAAIDVLRPLAWRAKVHAADRERVASDLAGIEEHCPISEAPLSYCASHSRHTRWLDCPDSPRYTAGLIRTAALYGVTS